MDRDAANTPQTLYDKSRFLSQIDFPYWQIARLLTMRKVQLGFLIIRSAVGGGVAVGRALDKSSCAFQR